MASKGLLLLGLLLFPCHSFRFNPGTTGCTAGVRHGGNPASMTKTRGRPASRQAPAVPGLRASAAEGEEERPSGDARAESAAESTASEGGGGSASGPTGGGEEGVSESGAAEGAESMELRDFRARLMSKGLDGWGGGGEQARVAVVTAAGGGARALRGGWAHPLVRPELGCLVIAKQGMFVTQQQYFYKAVALVIQHGDDGTVALILNRPTTFTMGDVCKGDLQSVPGMEDNVLYMGGDVTGARDDGLDVVNLMHGREDVPGMEVVKGLRLGGLKEALALVAQGRAQPEEFKFFSRYSGWGPGQLEAEVLAGAWELAACDLESVLESQNHPDQPGHFWGEIMGRLQRHRGSSSSSSSSALPDT
ncbi:unnamed protein product [Ectocarpus sp. CCAP 1310/34]|nr:unnamed protein product [Ectocarpus sp. CCAP 1310/34]